MKVRALAPAGPAEIDGDWVRFDQPELASRPGQAAVFYDGSRVLGGGWIAETGGGAAAARRLSRLKLERAGDDGLAAPAEDHPVAGRRQWRKPPRSLAWTALNSSRPRRSAQNGTSAACAAPVTGSSSIPWNREDTAGDILLSPGAVTMVSAEDLPRAGNPAVTARTAASSASRTIALPLPPRLRKRPLADAERLEQAVEARVARP